MPAQLDAFRLDGKIAFVTGASSGLGAHFARTLAAAGATVAIGARRVDKLEALADEIGKDGGRAHALPLDVTDPASIKAAYDAIAAQLGPVDIVVNNAGIPVTSRFLSITEEQWRSLMDVNLDGVFRVGQEAARRMKAAGNGGSIINIASILAFGVIKTLAPYSASKAAVVQLTRAMALELAPDNIRVNAIAPGYIRTEMNSDFFDTDAGKRLIAGVPFRRLGEPEELDGALLLLASKAGSFMTGTTITIDGGHLLPMGS